MKSIKSLDVNKIQERHLVRLEVGDIVYQRRTLSPIAFSYNGGTFTTPVSQETRKFNYIGVNSGASSFAGDLKMMFEETENRKGNLKIYKVTVKKKIDRVLDLDEVCHEQGIDFPYLHEWFTRDGRNPIEESKLFNLYGIKLGEKRIFGIKYTSRRCSKGQCFTFLDTLGNNLDDYIDIMEKLDE